MPPSTRAAISMDNPGAKQVPTAEKRKSSAARSSIFFLPNRSLSSPAKATPAIQPIRAEETNKPSSTAVNEIGRASCRESVCQYVYISVVAVYLQKTYEHLLIFRCS